MFNMKQVITLTLMCLTILSAQTIDFDLKEYKQPEMKRHSLETSFGLRGDHDFGNSDREYNESDYFDDENSHSFNSSSDNFYSYFKHSDKLQRGLSTGVTFSQNFYSYGEESTDWSDPNEIDKYDRSSNSFHTSMDISGYNRFYPTNSMFFIETNLDLSPNIYISKTENKYDYILTDNYIDATVAPFDYMEYNSTFSSENDFDGTSNGYAIRINPEFIVGFGKIENVSDARLAVYILQDLQDKKCLLKQPTKKEIIKLAELISTLKNERFFDDREKRIADITKIDEFLSNNSLVEDQNAAYFTSIYDNWDYANQSRHNGSRFSLGFVPEFQFSTQISKYEDLDIVNNIYEYDFYTSDILDSTNIQTTSRKDIRNDKYTNNNSIVGLEGVLKYEHSTPFNLFFQGDLTAELNYGITSDSTYTDNDRYRYYEDLDIQFDGIDTDSTYTQTESDTTYNHKTSREYDQLRLNVRYDLSYYLNTRTDFKLSLQGTYSIRNGTYGSDDDDETEFSSEQLFVSLGLGTNYYLSPQLRLSGSITSYYNYDTYNYQSQYNYSNRDTDEINFSYGLSLDYYMF